MKNKMVHIISDPIHGAMRFTHKQKEIIKKIIDDRIFQRLRRIKQLGCGDLLFPGAVHTRFNHMIGVCYLAKRLCVCLKLDKKLEDNDIHAIMIAGLLHDIGHGPFSHAFEKIFISNKFKDAEISHDDEWLKKFLEYFKSLSIPDLDFPQVEEILLKKITGDSRFKVDIISSQLDVDRMDYLLRDSHFCGVPYGKIDLKWLLSCIKVCNINSEKRLAISKKGIGALEHYINARRLMTKYIYYHGKKNASEYYVRKFLEELCDFTDDKNIVNFPLINFLKLYKEYIEKIENSNKSKKELKSEFVNTSFDYYKIITDDDVWFLINYFSSQRNDNACFQLAERLLTRDLPYSYLLNPAREHETEKIIQKFEDQLDVNDKWKIYVDKLGVIPYKSDKAPIYTLDGNCVIDILHESLLLNLLSNRHEVTHYLYLDKHLDVKILNKIIIELNSNYCFKSPVNSLDGNDNCPTNFIIPL